MDLNLMIEGQEGVSWPQWQALARACEASGIPALFRSDHYLSVMGVESRESLDAWATLTALAAETTSLRLGTLVSPVTFRHPSELAKVVAVADHVSGGRVELGLGAGWNEREHAAFGFPFPGLKSRMDMLAEQLEIVHETWTSSGPFSFAGEHYSIDALDARPRPVQSPHPPLLMGGQAGPRAAALAARWADEYNAVLAPFDEVVARKQRIEAACEAAGREPIPVSLMTGVLVGRDRAEYEERVRLLSERVGTEPGEIWIHGTADEVAERLGTLRDAGIARVMCQQLLHDDLDMVALIGEVLAPQVA